VILVCSVVLPNPEYPPWEFDTGGLLPQNVICVRAAPLTYVLIENKKKREDRRFCYLVAGSVYLLKMTHIEVVTSLGTWGTRFQVH
jgi:hypothetical protein